MAPPQAPSTILKLTLTLVTPNPITFYTISTFYVFCVSRYKMCIGTIAYFKGNPKKKIPELRSIRWQLHKPFAISKVIPTLTTKNSKHSQSRQVPIYLAYFTHHWTECKIMSSIWELQLVGGCLGQMHVKLPTMHWKVDPFTHSLGHSCGTTCRILFFIKLKS